MLEGKKGELIDGGWNGKARVSHRCYMQYTVVVGRDFLVSVPGQCVGRESSATIILSGFPGGSRGLLNMFCATNTIRCREEDRGWYEPTNERANGGGEEDDDDDDDDILTSDRL